MPMGPYGKRGVLYQEGKKHREEILAILDSVIMLKEVAIVHCPGHQKTDSYIAKGNNLADRAIKQAVRNGNGSRESRLMGIS